MLEAQLAHHAACAAALQHRGGWAQALGAAAAARGGAACALPRTPLLTHTLPPRKETLRLMEMQAAA